MLTRGEGIVKLGFSVLLGVGDHPFRGMLGLVLRPLVLSDNCNPYTLNKVRSTIPNVPPQPIRPLYVIMIEGVLCAPDELIASF